MEIRTVLRAKTEAPAVSTSDSDTGGTAGADAIGSVPGSVDQQRSRTGTGVAASASRHGK